MFPSEMFLFSQEKNSLHASESCYSFLNFAFQEARPVSCYAFFEAWLLPSQSSGCSSFFKTLTFSHEFRILSGESGLLPSWLRTLAHKVWLYEILKADSKFPEDHQWLVHPSPLGYSTRQSIQYEKEISIHRLDLNPFRQKPAMSELD